MAGMAIPSMAVAIAPPEVTASDVMVRNIDTGEVLYSKGGTVERRGRSLAKMMTVYILLRENPTLVDLAETTTIVSEDLSGGGTGQNLDVGDVISLHSLLVNAMMPSSNNSCLAIARVIGQEFLDSEEDTVTDPVDRFVAEMNTVAASLGCTDTLFEDPHGNSHQQSSVADMTTIFAAVCENEILHDIWRWQEGLHLPIVRDGSPYLLNVGSTMPMLGDPGIIGGKTGSPNWNLIVLWEAPNGQYIVAGIMGAASSEDRLADMRAIIAELPVDFPVLATPKDPWTPGYMFSSLQCGGAWIDCTDTTTIFSDTLGGTQVVDNGAVAVVEDKSGNGNHVTQSTAGSRPLFRGDDPRIEFDGSNDFLTFGAGRIDNTGLFADENEEFMVLIRAASDGEGKTGTLLGRAGSSSGSRTYQLYFDSGTSTPAGYLRGQAVSTSLGLNDGSPHVMHSFWDREQGGFGGGPSVAFHLLPGSASEETGQHIIVGARTGGTGFLLDGSIYQLIITDKYDRDQYRRARDWLAGASVNQARDPTGGISTGVSRQFLLFQRMRNQ